jgi:hypothetical protein
MPRLRFKIQPFFTHFSRSFSTRSRGMFKAYAIIKPAIKGAMMLKKADIQPKIISA